MGSSPAHLSRRRRWLRSPRLEGCLARLRCASRARFPALLSGRACCSSRSPYILPPEQVVQLCRAVVEERDEVVVQWCLVDHLLLHVGGIQSALDAGGLDDGDDRVRQTLVRVDTVERVRGRSVHADLSRVLDLEVLFKEVLVTFLSVKVVVRFGRGRSSRARADNLWVLVAHG